MSVVSLLAGWPLGRLVALHRVAKTRGRAFFADPREMKRLRELIDEKRGITTPPQGRKPHGRYRKRSA